IDETAYIDGYSFPRFFIKIFIPLIASGVGVAGFFCFMFSWVELLLASTPQSMPEAETVRVMIAEIGFAAVVVSVRAS
ncbi:carbohydrate ABC transporter permease, partial [Rhizobium leguminosarum]